MAKPTAQQLVGYGAALQGAQGLYSAYQTQDMAQRQVQMLDTQLAELDARNAYNLNNIRETGDRIVAEQAATFISAGVALEGSAMSVISDTMNDAAEEVMIAQREYNYNRLNIVRDREYYKTQASTETFLLNAAVSGMNAYSSYQTGSARVSRAHTKNRGATGIE